MKILAIRGSNLASLEGEFAIELEQDPLAQAGLFAITGPTGAGKSTLLDALCVALFDKTPRLYERGGVPVGRADQDEKDRLPANDVRGLLRRGCGEGHAEVDFLGRDQRVYRARWLVRRARRQPDGRLQAQEMSLEDVQAGKSLGSTRTEVLEEMERRLGLSFEQFRRSALLAQGDFASFLRADERGRGELLERMTGTEIYSEISMAAFERHKREALELERLQQMIASRVVLDDGAREALEAEAAAAAQALARAEAAMQAASDAVVWYARRDELAGEVEVAAAARARAEQAWTDAAGLRQELVGLERALALGPAVEAARRSERAWAEVAADLAAGAQRAETGTRAQEAARLAAERAEAELERVRAAREEAQPALRAAESLDAQVRFAAQAAEQAATAWGEAAQQAGQAEGACARLAGEVAGQAARAAAARAWLAQRPYMDAVSEGWQRWHGALDRHVDAAQAWGEKAEMHAVLGAAHGRAEALLGKARALAEDGREARDAAQARAEKAQRLADEVPLEAVRRERDALAGRRDAMRDLTSAAARAYAAQEACTQALAASESASREAAEAQAEAGALEREIEELDVTLHEAERALGNLRLALDLGAQRLRLRDGDACPLCGSVEHPFRHGASGGDTGRVSEHDAAAGHEADIDAGPEAALARLVAAEEQRVDDLRSRHGACRERRADARARVRAAMLRRNDAAQKEQAARAVLAEVRGIWAEQLRSLGELMLLADPADPHAARGIEARLKAMHAQIEVLRERERTAAELAQGARRASGLAAARENDLFQAQVLVTEREATARRAREQLDRCEQERGRLADIAEEAARELGRAFAGDASVAGVWRAQLEADPVGFRSAWRAAAEGWQRRQDARARAESALDRLRAELSHVQARAVEAGARARAAQAAHETQAATLAGTRARRGALLGGEATEQVRTRLEAAVGRCEDTARTAREAREAARAAAAEAQARLAALQKEHARALAERAAAGAALARGLDEAGLTLAAVEALLGRGQERLEAGRAELGGREQALAQARAVHAERLARQQRFEGQDAPAPARAEAEDALARGGAACSEARQALYELQLKLRMDDDARRHQSEVGRQHRAQLERVRLYADLSELIGSADGKKLRVFAQSLTLDALLAHANAHLDDLSPRYRLARVPGHDLDLQVVDRDMGDEIRSVHSLSGGESFLASLALALGLSSLSARDTRVESLLIDEGFGSLDPSTFEVALAVLDALQASGRKVGVISHVPGLAERIGVRIAVKPQGPGRSVVRVMER
jgi:exonuclease SbcC